LSRRAADSSWRPGTRARAVRKLPPVAIRLGPPAAMGDCV
jgi:hypothetical protein